MESEIFDRRRFLKSAIGGTGLGVCSVRHVWAQAEPSIAAKTWLAGLTWIRHAGFRMEESGSVLYFDPWNLTESPLDADFIFISHSHDDHCQLGSLGKIRNAGTRFITNANTASKIAQYASQTTLIAAGETLLLSGYTIEAVPAYNINKNQHPKSNGWLGYIVTLRDGRKLYHAGDTDLIPEMENFRTDIALLPIGGTFTMTPTEAAEAVRTIQPQVAIPMHYGSIAGTTQDALNFQQLLEGEVEVVVMSAGQAFPQMPAGMQRWNWF